MLPRVIRSQPSQEKGSWLTIKQVAGGLQVSRDTVVRWIHDGELRAVNVSAGIENGAQRVSWRIKPENLEMFLEERANRPPLPRKAPTKRNNTGIVQFIK
jgi:excisionase family DNA binding protein